MMDDPAGPRPRMKPRLHALRPATLLVLASVLASCVSSTPASPGSPGSPGIPSTAAPATTSPGGPAASGESTPGPSTTPTGSLTPSTGAIEALPAGEGVLNAIWIGEDRVVVGGFAGPGFSSTILVFAAGSWSVADVPAAAGQVTGIAEIGDRLIAVGHELPDNRNGFIWESTDGGSWRAVQTIEDAALYAAVAGDGVVVAVGARLDTEMNATASAWSSTDGTTWEAASVDGSRLTAMGSVTTTPEGFAAIGARPLGDPRPFWTAAAPRAWAALDNDLDDQLLPIDTVFWRDQFVLVGASGRSGDQHPFVALSADGRAWARTNLSDVEGYAAAVAVAEGRLVVAGVDEDRLTLWTLGDAEWGAETIEPSGASISALAWDTDLGLLAAGSRDGRLAVWLVDDKAYDDTATTP
jgi:molecular chaperone DnaK